MEDIKSFAADFMTNIQVCADLENKDFDEELTECILEYIEDCGDVGAPNICSFKKRMTSLNAYDYNYEGDSLDLFILTKSNSLLGRINKGKIDDSFSKLYHFYEEVKNGKIKSEIDNPNEELAEVANLITSTIGRISTLRLFVLTNGLCDDYDTSTVESEHGFILEQNVWDIQRIYQQHCLKSGKSSIVIDFPTIYNIKLQCIKLMSNNDYVESYLAIIPAITLANIYKDYQHNLLEKNVRTFLQFKPKVNQGIRKTLREEPDMFFSYNNGISSTANKIETVRRDGALYITKLINWQIVNGGQTTGTILSTYKEKGSDLSDVYVPMKISVIQDDEKSKILVDRISQYANSQTAIKTSDFSANDPYLIKLEELSRSEWIPNGKSKSVSKWYFERTRGQYLDELAQKRGINEKLFRAEYPKNHKIVKTDIAVYEECWDLNPNMVCKGPEQCYLQFVKKIKSSQIIVTSAYYKKIIAKAILFKSIDKIVRDKQLGGYKANMNAYILASLSLISQKMLDLDYIWENQKIQPELQTLIMSLVPIIWSHITNPSATNQSINPATWSKNQECWETLKLKLDSIHEISENLIAPPESLIDENLTQARKDKIYEAWSHKSEEWYSISKWAKENNKLTPIERKFLVNIGSFKSRNRQFTFKEANDALLLIDKAKEQGFL